VPSEHIDEPDQERRPEMRKFHLTPIALALCLAGAAPAGAADEPGLIVVQGSGIVEVAPDTAEIAIGVDTRARTAVEAIDGNSAAMERVVADAVRAGIERKDIRTALLSLTGYEDNGAKRFRATNMVRVQLRDLSRLGAVVRDLVGSGANEIRGISFSTRDPAPHFVQARRQAVEDARKRAETLAEAAGQRLGQIVEITDQTYSDPGIRAEAAMQRTNVPVEPGQIAMRAGVQIKWRLAP
jgi:uncharacterized protein YggE